jgi:hypothetical protein
MTSNYLVRWQELIAGGIPQDRAEELFILGYKYGLGSELLIYALLSISDIIEGLEIKELQYFTCGYALGQKTWDDAEEETTDFVRKQASKSNH